MIVFSVENFCTVSVVTVKITIKKILSKKKVHSFSSECLKITIKKINSKQKNIEEENPLFFLL